MPASPLQWTGTEELLFGAGGGGAQQQNEPRAANVAFSATGRVHSKAANGDCLLPTAPAQAGIDSSTSFSQATGASDDQTTRENLSRTAGGTDASGESVVVATAGTSGRGGGGGYWDWVQGSLDVAGCVPILGEAPDGANLVISLFRRDWTGAGLSALSMIPVYGDAVGKGGKLARYVAKYGDEAVAALDALRGVRRVKGAVRSFKNFDAFKAALGPAGDGKVWHHIVEQRPSNIARFGPEAVHNTANVVAVPREVNQRIADYYSSKPPRGFTGGKKVREWLNSQSYEEQQAFGLKILQMVLEGKPLP